MWINATLTPLERPAQFAGKAVLTEQEAAEYVKQTLQQVNSDRRDGGTQVDVNRSYNEFWRDRGNNLVADRRTSLITDPPDGRVPPLTPEAQKRMEESRAWMRDHATDGPEGRSLAERCISWTTAGPPMLPGPYNNDFQIVQTRDTVVISNEMIHDARMIPLDGRPHVSQNIRALDGRFARTLGRQYAGGRHHKFHQRIQLSRIGREYASDRALHARVARRDRIRIHRRRSHSVHSALDRANPAEQNTWPDL